MSISGTKMERLFTSYFVIVVVCLNKVALPKCIDDFYERQLFQREGGREKFCLLELHWMTRILCYKKSVSVILNTWLEG